MSPHSTVEPQWTWLPLFMHTSVMLSRPLAWCGHCLHGKTQQEAICPPTPILLSFFWFFTGYAFLPSIGGIGFWSFVPIHRCAHWQISVSFKGFCKTWPRRLLYETLNQDCIYRLLPNPNCYETYSHPQMYLLVIEIQRKSNTPLTAEDDTGYALS